MFSLLTVQWVSIAFSDDERSWDIKFLFSILLSYFLLVYSKKRKSLSAKFLMNDFLTEKIETQLSIIWSKEQIVYSLFIHSDISGHSKNIYQNFTILCLFSLTVRILLEVIKSIYSLINLYHTKADKRNIQRIEYQHFFVVSFRLILLLNCFKFPPGTVRTMILTISM